ncbi:uncharacterized protein LOC125658236 [Ostrea edulis]|uniref:uncharacterized protein LOC125658236 n=1 Tax=Ostrea edulis TaxID=37623 RepID=UPI0024AFDE7D|nr:uncharacterized protein LOC125658236 [Ostrea edulis]
MENTVDNEEYLSWVKVTIAPLLFILFTLKGLWSSQTNSGYKLMYLFSNGNVAQIVSSIIFIKVFFDVICLVFGTKVVRRKIYKPFKPKKFTILLTVLLTFSTADCPTELVSHDGPNGEIVCCKGIACAPGNYVQTCRVNNTEDFCLPCGPHAYLPDATDSNFPVPCIPAKCPPDTIMTTAFPKAGCRMLCKCDTGRGYFGPDPCNCKSLFPRYKVKTKQHQVIGKRGRDDYSIKPAVLFISITAGIIVLVWCLYLLYDRLHQERVQLPNA